MTEYEIEQYIETIKPSYSKAMIQSFARVDSELEKIEAKVKQINMCLHKKQDCPESLAEQKKTIIERAKQLQFSKHILRYKAMQRGFRGEWLKVKDLPRNEISDICKQAEILTILDNHSLQLAEVCQLMKSSDLSEGYSISFGETSTLRGSWEDAVDAVELIPSITTADDTIPEDESTKERQKRLKRWLTEEELKGKGAIKRTAAREGIARQTLAEILKR
jgi:hypothetical protein